MKIEALEIISRIDESLEAKSTRRATMLQELGLIPNTIANWESHSTIGRADVLLKISNYLDVDLEWLVCGKTSRLSAEERALVSSYRNMDEKKKALAKKIVEDIAAS